MRTTYGLRLLSEPRVRLSVIVLVAAILVIYQYQLIEDRTRDGCFKAFRLNHWLGFTVFAGVVAGYALK